MISFREKVGTHFSKQKFVIPIRKKKSSNEKWAMELPNIPHKNLH